MTKLDLFVLDDKITPWTWEPHFFDGAYLHNCSSLTILPRAFGILLCYWNKVTSLFNTSLTSLMSFLVSLTFFDWNECLRLTTLHTEFGNLTPLTYLWLYGCLSLTILSKGVENRISSRNLWLRLGNLTTRT